MRVLVVLPTYNEILNVEAMTRALREAVPDAEILVFDDASPDGTGKKVRELAGELGQIHLLERSAKAGLGSAYRAGFAWGLEHGYDHFVEIDCDFSHDPTALPGLLALGESYDVVIGSRYITGGSIPKWSLPRRLLSSLGNRYASFMLGLGVADSTAGYRVYSARGLALIDFRSVTADGYGFQIEMTYRARAGGASIIESPISFSDRTRGESKMSSAIVAEALVLVTRWGAVRLARRVAGR